MFEAFCSFRVTWDMFHGSKTGETRRSPDPRSEERKALAFSWEVSSRQISASLIVSLVPGRERGKDKAV